MFSRVFLIGKLVRCNIVRTQTGFCGLSITIKTEKLVKNEVKAQHHSVSYWGKNAEDLAGSLKDGSLVVCDGELEYYKGKDDGYWRAQIKANTFGPFMPTPDVDMPAPTTETFPSAPSEFIKDEEIPF